MSEWIAVCEDEGDNPIEVETEEDCTLLLETLTAHFPGTTTLKYRSKETNAFRSVKCSSGVLKAPGGSWDQAPLYICVNPTKPEGESRKRPAPEPATEMTNSKRVQSIYPEYDPTKCSDLIVLGLKPTTAASEIQDFFEKFGDVEMVQTKNSKDKNVAFAFIRFKDKLVERKVLREKHTIDDRECTVRIPDSQQGDKSLRKIYVSYHNQSLKEADIKEHFEKFGDVVEVFVPNPWRHFCFVTFHDGRVAQSLVGKEHEVNGVSMLIKSAGNVKGRKQDENGGGGDYHGQDQMGGGGYGGWGAHQQQGGWGPGMGGGMGGGGHGMGGGAPMGNMGNMGGNMGGMGGNMGGGNMGSMGGNMGPGNGPNMGNGGGGWPGAANYGYGGNPGPVPPPQPQGYGGQQQNVGYGNGASAPDRTKSRA